MQSNNIICYVCKKIIKNLEEASYIGKDLVTKKEKYRHRECSPHGFQKRPRGKWYINPKTKIKESDTIYNRDKEKQKFRKELERE